MSAPDSTRHYDKGERRFKHVGATKRPEFRFVRNNPKHVIGLCPADVPPAERARLLAAAIPASRSPQPVPRLYAVHQGAIYEARSSDWGRSYHAYPFRGKLTATLLAALAEMAEQEGCIDAFHAWVRAHIQGHGR